MKLYNTLTRKNEELRPINPPEVTIYTCGPTVYDYSHIGHWFTYVRWDTLIRTLKYNNFKPKWVMNITDVGHLVSDADDGEDKLEKGAKREGKNAWQVAEYYTSDFINGLNELNITLPDFMPKATEHIKEQIELIKTLEAKGYAYVIDDGIYYDTSKFEGYSAFARLDLDDIQAGARVAYNQQKRQPSDFALWKFSPKNKKRDMEWDSPWGKGFPGWHIECSAMSMKYLGETLDIHTGGIDHIPVHHTNEIAQSEAATGKRFSNVWLHSNHVLIDGEKISKSLGNGLKISDIKAKGFSVQVLRLHILESHYRSQSRFSWESLDSSKNRLQRWSRVADLRWQIKSDTTDSATQDILDQINAAMADDLNSPLALSIIDQVLDKVEATENNVALLDKIIDYIGRVFGIYLAREDITPEQKDLIIRRQTARSNKDWVLSDQIRSELLNEGIGLLDNQESTKWFRLSLLDLQ